MNNLNNLNNPLTHWVFSLINNMVRLKRYYGSATGSYIGDSGTDIQCLTENGTVGIVMRADTNSSLIETLNRVGIDVKHISAYKKMRKSAVYQAQNFKEILEGS